MKIWLISDTHFNHKKLVEFEGRPENFNDLIIHHWNYYINEGDVIIHLGDVILGHDSDLKGIMERLRGRKVLVRGNHDRSKPDNWYYMRGFNFVCDYFVWKDIAFSHVPLTPLPQQGFERQTEQVALNIHGHFHKGLHRGHAGVQDDNFNFPYYEQHKDKYKLLQIEDDFKPVELKEFIKNYETRL